MSNRTYDFLKYFVLIVMPAVTTFVGIVGQAYDFPDLERTITVLTAATAFLGTITGVSAYTHNKEDK